MRRVFRQGQTGDRIGPQLGVAAFVCGDFGQRRAGVVGVAGGQRTDDFKRQQRIVLRQQAPQQLDGQLGVIRRGQPQGVTLQTSWRGGIIDPLYEHVGVGDACFRLAAQRVPGRQRRFEQSIVQIGPRQHSLDVGFKVDQHRIGDPAQALEANFGIRVVK